MRAILLVLALAFCCGSPAAPEVNPDAVVARVNGKELTAASVDALLSASPPAMREKFRADKKTFLEQFALVELLAAKAAEAGLDKKSPYKDQVGWATTQVLFQAAIADKQRELAAAPDGAATADAGVKEWLDSMQGRVQVTILDEAFLESSSPQAQAAPKSGPVVSINGREYTAGDVEGILRGAPPNVRQNFNTDRRRFLEQYGMILLLAEDARQRGLEQKIPYRDQLTLVRFNVLMQAALGYFTNAIRVSDAEQTDYYNKHQDDFTTVSVKVIYIPFGTGKQTTTDASGREILREADARSRADAIREQILGGADFAEMVERYSQDAVSKAKGGDFGVFNKNDRLPDHIKAVVFDLEPGGISEPVRQPNGFYLFRVTEKGTQALSKARAEVIEHAKNAKFKAWFDEIRGAIDVNIENEEFFAAPAEK